MGDSVMLQTMMTQVTPGVCNIKSSQYSTQIQDNIFCYLKAKRTKFYQYTCHNVICIPVQGNFCFVHEQMNLTAMQNKS